MSLGLAGLQREFQDSQGYLVRPCLKRQNNKKRDEIAQHSWPGKKRERHLDLASDNLMKQHGIPKTKGVLEVTSV